MPQHVCLKGTATPLCSMQGIRQTMGALVLSADAIHSLKHTTQHPPRDTGVLCYAVSYMVELATLAKQCSHKQTLLCIPRPCGMHTQHTTLCSWYSESRCWQAHICGCAGTQLQLVHISLLKPRAEMTRLGCGSTLYIAGTP